MIRIVDEVSHETELAWASGFFDGEGTCTVVPAGRSCSFMVAVKQSTPGLRGHEVPAVLERFHLAVGLGRIGGPYQQKPSAMEAPLGFGRRKPFYMWYARNGVAIEVVAKLRFLSPVKLEQAAMEQARWQERLRALARSRGA